MLSLNKKLTGVEWLDMKLLSNYYYYSHSVIYHSILWKPPFNNIAATRNIFAYHEKTGWKDTSCGMQALIHYHSFTVGLA